VTEIKEKQIFVYSLRQPENIGLSAF